MFQRHHANGVDTFVILFGPILHLLHRREKERYNLLSINTTFFRIIISSLLITSQSNCKYSISSKSMGCALMPSPFGGGKGALMSTTSCHYHIITCFSCFNEHGCRCSYQQKHTGKQNSFTRIIV